jgi:hypothetical protein
MTAAYGRRRLLAADPKRPQQRTIARTQSRYVIISEIGHPNARPIKGDAFWRPPNFKSAEHTSVLRA